MTTAAETRVTAAERNLWESLEKRHLEAFDAGVAGMTYVDAGGIVTFAKGTAAPMFKASRLNSYNLTDVRTRLVGTGVVVLTYKAVVDETVYGKSQPSPIYAMSVWHRKAGKWIPVAHAEIPVAKP